MSIMGDDKNLFNVSNGRTIAAISDGIINKTA